MTETKAHLRLFFALWPDAAAAEKLRNLQSQLALRGRRTSLANLHVTLAFIGEADEAYTACVERAAANVRAIDFVMRLDQVGYFRKPRIVWLGPHQTPAGLQQLYHDLGQSLSDCGFEPSARFRPHVTLARNAQPLKQVGTESVDIEPVVWRATEFTLVESRVTDTGAAYRVRRRYPFEYT